MDNIHALVEAQRRFFRTNATLDVKFRVEALKKLRRAVMEREAELCEALNADLGRSPHEAYLCDVGVILFEIDEAIRGIRKWAKPETRFSGLHCFPSIITKVYKMPYGVTLIISPFNFPLLLSLGVLTASIAGGNTAIIKASSKSPNCTEAMKRLVADIFPQEYVTVLGGGHDVADELLNERFDKIFYTGSPKVGKHVMAEAAKNLTPVALELGGETGNWAVVRADADIRDAARKIAFFKSLNAGQICININQVAVAKSVAGDFIEALRGELRRQLGDDPAQNPEYPHLINRAAYDKCAALVDSCRDRAVIGGEGDESSLRYAPTVIYPVKIDEEIVLRELFCPILPVVEYDDDRIDELMNVIADREHGLSLYLFTRDKKWAEKTMRTQQFGGGCVNEVCVHLMVEGAPFNGVGHSGIGAYHGEWGFREFTHPQTVLYGSAKFNLTMREHPYTKIKSDSIKAFLK